MTPDTLSIDQFIAWLPLHPNCILRAGTPEVVLFDDEDLHWMFVAEDEQTLFIQLLRGKRMAGEIQLKPEDISYVLESPGEVDGEVFFELVDERQAERRPAYLFVMSHGYKERDPGDLIAMN